VAKHGGSGWLKRLFGGIQESEDEEEPTQNAEQPKETEPVVSVQPQQHPDEESLLLEVEGGAMTRVWQQWMGESSTPPQLSLTGRGQEKELPLSGEHAVSREKLRLRAQLEKDARERMRVIDSRREGEDLNAECRVYLSRFGMVAWVFVFPPVGVTGQFRMEDIGKALQAGGVTSGIDTAAILRIAQKKAVLRPDSCRLRYSAHRGHGWICGRALPQRVQAGDQGG
jgi:hypothetical protein